MTFVLSNFELTRLSDNPAATVIAESPNVNSSLRHSLSPSSARSDPNVQRQLLPQEEDLLSVNPVSAAWLDLEEVKFEEQGGEHHAHLDPGKAMVSVSSTHPRLNTEVLHSLHAHAIPRSNAERIEYGSTVFLELNWRLLQPALREEF